MRRHIWPVALRLLLVAGVLVLLAILIPRGSLRSAWAVIGRLGWREVLALVLVNGAIVLLIPARWWLLLCAYGFRLPYAAVTAHRLTAYGVSFFTPGPQFGGEPIQVYAAEQVHRVPRPIAAASVALDKALELAINFLFLFIGLIYVLLSDVSPIIPGTPAVLLAGTLLLIPASLLIAYLAGRQPVTHIVRLAVPLVPPGTLKRMAHRLFALTHATETQMSAYFRRSPGNFARVMGVSGLTWLLMVGEFWLMTYFLGLYLTLPQVAALLVAARIALLLPVPGGFGTLVGSQILMLTAMKMDPAAGLSLGLVIHARDISLAGAGLLLPMFTNRLRIPAKYTKVSAPSPPASSGHAIEDPARMIPPPGTEKRHAAHANNLPLI